MRNGYIQSADVTPGCFCGTGKLLSNAVAVCLLYPPSCLDIPRRTGVPVSGLKPCTALLQPSAVQAVVVTAGWLDVYSSPQWTGGRAYFLQVYTTAWPAWYLEQAANWPDSRHYTVLQHSPHLLCKHKL